MKDSPAFFYALFFLLGTGSALAFHWSYLIPLLLCLWIIKKKSLWGILFFITGFIWAAAAYTLPSLPEEGVEGNGRFSIQSISLTTSPFQKSIVFQGELKSFNGWRSIPCRIYFKDEALLPPGNCDLQMTGKLLPKTERFYVLKPIEISPIENSFSLAHWRYEIKNRLKDHLIHCYRDTKSCAFLLSMLTGQANDRLLTLEFNRLGILHLLGISGFQFAILAFLIGSILRLVFPFRLSCGILILLLSAYAFILGDSPPIERAWIGISLYLIALICGYRISALNALGVALLWQLIKDPLLIFHLGFQFSFLCTAAILIVYPIIKSWLIPQRTFQEALKMPLLDQQGHIVSHFCFEAVALNLAIHLTTLPLIFYHFHKLPLLSFIYNLFLPAAVSVIYLLMLIALGLDLFFVGGWLHAITGKLTSGVLVIATHPPALYDFQLRIGNFSLGAAVVTITLLFYLTRFKPWSKPSPIA